MVQIEDAVKYSVISLCYGMLMLHLAIHLIQHEKWIKYLLISGVGLAVFLYGLAPLTDWVAYGCGAILVSYLIAYLVYKLGNDK